MSRGNLREGAPPPIRVALFCGGRGSGTIIRALLRNTDLSLTLLVNAYDDGLSTGALRNFIPGMLGPSDFRKNYSALVSTYSNSQYSLRALFEYRLPLTVSESDVENIAAFCKSNDLDRLWDPVRKWCGDLTPQSRDVIRQRLDLFFDFAKETGAPFDFADCSLGNLIFAGAYLNVGRDFNRAAADIGRIVGARASLVNVSQGENRILVGLKSDGALLTSEAQIVGSQSSTPIRDFYFLEQSLLPTQIDQLNSMSTIERAEYLGRLDAVPALSAEAEAALYKADIILFGPGTQHSSLLPSYRIASDALKLTNAPVRALVMNLDEDHDIGGLTASDLVDRVLRYSSAEASGDRLLTHILVNRDRLDGRLPEGDLSGAEYRGASILHGEFANGYRPGVHNGAAVVEAILAAWKATALGEGERDVEIHVDINRRTSGVSELVDDYLEVNWRSVVGAVNVAIKADPQASVAIPAGAHISLVPEIEAADENDVFFNWLDNGQSEYLVLICGDGAYKFEDVLSALRLLSERPLLSAVFGSRTQSRRQFISSIEAAYGENKSLYMVAKFAQIVLSLILYLRAGVVFSDPLTGLRVFKRSQLKGLRALPAGCRPRTMLGVARALLQGGMEVAEVPAAYRTFAGFTEPGWRVRRGLRALADLAFG